jgi:hypothetical protein
VELRNAYTISVGKPVRMESLGRLRIVGDAKQICLRKKSFWNTDWIYLARVRDRWWALVNKEMNRLVP